MERRETEIVRDDTTGTAREESHITSTDPVAAASADSAEVVSTVSPGRRAVEMTYLVFGIIEGLLASSYNSLTMDDQEDRFEGFQLLSRQVWKAYMSKIPKEREKAIGLRPLAEIDREVRSRILDPEHGWPPEVRAVLRTKLRLPKEAPVPVEAATDAPQKISPQ